MKHSFINKKTGAEARVIAMYLDSDGVMQVDGYDTVEDLMDDYAAYERYNPPKEPLIKDEKIRKVVQAWADLYGYKFVTHRFYTTTTGHRWSLLAREAQEICLPDLDGLEESKDYTIAELCGEEEE